MPKFLVPHKTGPHRVAAIALYRALISQASKFANDDSRVHDLIQSRFREARHVTSIKRLKLLFTAGYEAIDLLDGAVAGDAQAEERIEALVRQAKPVELKKRNAIQQEQVPLPWPERMDMFSRPLPKGALSGERKVPILVNANHIPILRFTKPQPRVLSFYLHSRIVQRQKRQDLRWRLEDELRVAKGEDTWEWLMNGKKPLQDEEGYTFEVARALQEVQEKLQQEREKNRDMAEKMQGVVDREREMAERERLEAGTSVVRKIDSHGPEVLKLGPRA